MIPILIAFLSVTLLMIASMWTIFSKANQPGWACIIPIYNIIVLLKIAGKPLWWFFLLLIPILNFAIIIMIYQNLSKSFNKSGGFTVGLLFLPIIFFPVLAFSSSQYVGISK